MSVQYKCLLMLSIFLCIFPEVLSIKCWKCQSNNDPKCADPFDNTTIPITDCKQEKGLPHLPSMCRKIRQKVNGEWQYIRDCAYLEEVDIQGDELSCVMRPGTDNSFVEYCTCNNKDVCNSSSMTQPIQALFVMLVSLPYFLVKIISC